MKQVLFFVAALLPFVVLAQPNYHEGYIIKNNGDTLKGFVNYREWEYSPESVEFRMSKTDGAVLKFTADSVKGFGVTGFETYRSYVGDITLNKNIFPDIPSGIDTGHEIRAIFLKPITKGPRINLYYNNEVNKDRFFISEKGGQPIELRYYEYYTSGSAEAYRNVYKTQLQLLALKYHVSNKKIMDDLESARYELADIVDIVDEINGINRAQRQKADSVQSANSPAYVRFIAGIAANYTVNGGPSSSSLTPKFNAGIDVFFNPNVQQLFLRFELGYTWTTGKVPVLQQSDYGIITINQAFTQYTFLISPQVIFNVYNTDNLKIYIDGGANANFSSYDKQQYLRSFWVSFPLQTGIVFKRHWEVFVSYALKAKYSDAAFNTTSQDDCIGIKRLF